MFLFTQVSQLNRYLLILQLTKALGFKFYSYYSKSLQLGLPSFLKYGKIRSWKPRSFPEISERLKTNSL